MLKREFKGYVMVGGGRWWVKTARIHVAGSGLEIEAEKACHGEPFLAPGLRDLDGQDD
jgi:hypothetical protein